MLGPSPFALITPTWRLRALARAAGRAPLGGLREIALATLVATRLAAAAVGPQPLAQKVRQARAEAVHNWLGTIALAPVPKVALTRLVDTTGGADRGAMATALAKVTDVTAPQLDRAARSELELLLVALRTWSEQYA